MRVGTQSTIQASSSTRYFLHLQIGEAFLHRQTTKAPAITHTIVVLVDGALSTGFVQQM